jgi:histidyl-tRNA synthetase
MALRERLLAIFVETFKRHGAVAIETPVFELKEILARKYGDDEGGTTAGVMYDLADVDGEEPCSLRYDLTVRKRRKNINFWQ